MSRLEIESPFVTIQKSQATMSTIDKVSPSVPTTDAHDAMSTQKDNPIPITSFSCPQIPVGDARSTCFAALVCRFRRSERLIWFREHFTLPPAHLFSWEWDIDTSSPSSSTRSYSYSPWDGSSSMSFTCDGCCTGGRSPTRCACFSSSISSCTF